MSDNNPNPYQPGSALNYLWEGLEKEKAAERRLREDAARLAGEAKVYYVAADDAKENIAELERIIASVLEQ